MDTWRVPLIVDGAPRALLTVTRHNSKLRAVDFGAAGLARSLGVLENDLELPGGTERAVLRLFDMRRDFLMVGPPSDASQFYSISDTTLRLQNASKQAGAPPETESVSRADLFESVRGFRKAVQR